AENGEISAEKTKSKPSPAHPSAVSELPPPLPRRSLNCVLRAYLCILCVSALNGMPELETRPARYELHGYRLPPAKAAAAPHPLFREPDRRRGGHLRARPAAAGARAGCGLRREAVP